MVRKIGQIIRRGPKTWLVRIYVGRDRETRRRKYVGKVIHGGLRSAQVHLNRMLSERVAFTLEVYSHVLPHMQDTAAMKLEALLMAA